MKSKKLRPKKGDKLMSYRNVFPTILITISMLFHGCSSNRAITYVQGYYDRTLKESEVSWIKIGGVRNQNKQGYTIGHIEVMFDSLPQTKYISGINCYIFAFPTGDQTIRVRYYWSDGYSMSSWTDWVEITKSLEGGKCYVINDSLASKKHYFKIEDITCNHWFNCNYYSSIEFYRLGGYKAMPTLELIKTYKMDDDIFSTLERNESNNRITIPCEFIRKLYEQL